MHPRVNDTYQKLAQKYEMKGPFLEIGAGSNDDSILSSGYFQGKPERLATNLSDKVFDNEPDNAAKIQFIRCNANDMRAVFTDGQFGTVLCNAVIEHDKYFWRSLDEMKRVLAPGGILAIGAPGYIARNQLKDSPVSDTLPKATITFDLHSAPDYWRFSRMAFKEVICEGLEFLELCIVGRVPILIAVARKPLEGLLEPVPQEDRIRIIQAEKQAKVQQREVRLKEREAKEAAVSEAETPEARAAREARLQKREARLQEHAAKLAERKVKPEAKPRTEKRQAGAAKEARLQELNAKRQAREEKIKAGKAAKNTAPKDNGDAGD